MVKVFLSHTWCKDILQRDTHRRVLDVAQSMQRMGMDTWVDEEQMVHDIDNCMASGIEKCDAVVIFLTLEYFNKVQAAASHAKKRDNCYKEFSYAQSCGKVVLPIVFEPCVSSISKWPNGIIKLYLGNHLYIDGSDSLPHDVAFEVHKMLTRLSRNQNIQLSDPRNDVQKKPSRPAPILSRIGSATQIYTIKKRSSGRASGPLTGDELVDALSQLTAEATIEYPAAIPLSAEQAADVAQSLRTLADAVGNRASKGTIMLPAGLKRHAENGDRRHQPTTE